MIISPRETRHRGMRESLLRALDTGFPLCSTRWGPFYGAAYSPDADRLIAPTSGIGGPPTTGSRINIYKPDSLYGGIEQLSQLEGTTPSGAPVYVSGADKFFFGVRSFTDANVDSLTSVDGVATVTTENPHGLTTGDSVPISGADQTEYNGTFQVTVTGASTFTYEVTGTPTSPATGDIKWQAVADSAFAVVDPNTLAIEYIDGFGSPGFVAGGRAIYISSKDRVWMLGTGGIFEIDPADNSYTVLSPPGLGLTIDFVYCPADDFVYAKCLAGSFNTIKRIDVNSLAVTDITLLTSLTRSGAVATATTPLPHSLSNGLLLISHASDALYNGIKAITVTSPTTFTFSVSGTPATPATPEGPPDGVGGIRWGWPANFSAHGMTWVPDNGVDPKSNRIWVAIRDEEGVQTVFMFFLEPGTVGIVGQAGLGLHTILTFIPSIERIVGNAVPTQILAFKADLTFVLISSRTLTGQGCYCDVVNKAALPVIKDGRWCIEYYTQAQLS